MKGKWRYCSLREVADIYNGCDYKHNPIGEEYPIYGTGGEIGRTGAFLNSGSAILTGRKGSINNPFYVEGKFWHVDTIFCIKAKDKIDIKLLYYLFKSKDLSKLNEATGVPSVTSKALYNLIFSFPLDIVSQQHIADILTSCDEVIEQTEKAIAKYQAIKAGMLQDLFSRGVDANGKLRPTPEEAPELYKDSPLGKIPKEWECKEMKYLCTFYSGSGFPENLQGNKTGDYPFIKVSDMNIESNDVYLKNANNWISDSIANKLSAKVIPAGAVAFAKIGAAMLLNRRRITIRKTCFDNNMMAAIPENIDPLFLYYTFCNIDFADFVQTTALPSLDVKELKRSMHKVPTTIFEQKMIVARLSLMDEKIAVEKQTLKKYISIKQGLMKRLLTPPEGALEA